MLIYRSARRCKSTPAIEAGIRAWSLAGRRLNGAQGAQIKIAGEFEVSSLTQLARPVLMPCRSTGAPHQPDQRPCQVKRRALIC